MQNFFVRGMCANSGGCQGVKDVDGKPA